MILAIVGSTCLAGNPEARLAVEDIVDRHLDDPQNRPLVVCSGAALGVDSYAAESALARGAERVTVAELDGLASRHGDIWLLEFPPLCRQNGNVPPTGHRCTFGLCYRPRDRQIAQACDKLVRVVGKCTTTYGSGWTRDVATGLRKPTEEVVVTMTDPEVVRLARTACKAPGGLFPVHDAEAAVQAALGRHRMTDEVRVAASGSAVQLWRRERAGDRFLGAVQVAGFRKED